MSPYPGEDFAAETRRENHERDAALLADDPRLGFLDRMDRRAGGSVPPPAAAAPRAGARRMVGREVRASRRADDPRRTAASPGRCAMTDLRLTDRAWVLIAAVVFTSPLWLPVLIGDMK